MHIWILLCSKWPWNCVFKVNQRFCLLQRHRPVSTMISDQCKVRTFVALSLSLSPHCTLEIFWKVVNPEIYFKNSKINPFWHIFYRCMYVLYGLATTRMWNLLRWLTSKTSLKIIQRQMWRQIWSRKIWVPYLYWPPNMDTYISDRLAEVEGQMLLVKGICINSNSLSDWVYLSPFCHSAHSGQTTDRRISYDNSPTFAKMIYLICIFISHKSSNKTNTSKQTQHGFVLQCSTAQRKPAKTSYYWSIGSLPGACSACTTARVKITKSDVQSSAKFLFSVYFFR